MVSFSYKIIKDIVRAIKTILTHNTIHALTETLTRGIRSIRCIKFVVQAANMPPLKRINDSSKKVVGAWKLKFRLQKTSDNADFETTKSHHNTFNAVILPLATCWKHYAKMS